ncbi:TonB-dependent receptor family protein [Mucilaginibacter sp. HMF5004]|uniref:TonB-dependent receptor n=1 Tax=Mucilaginibacter rivuli TaxID=2857527 RepID=UPI001C5D4861|nr:TonB-dependent receptor [Mucilaginibacter rivuli]MBW4888933.1 TonB-dependent receptor family protein [Mucilaginibacter rivuli]
MAGLLLSGIVSIAQTRQLSGVVRDSTGNALPGATVKLIIAQDSTSAITNPDGVFEFEKIIGSEFRLKVLLMGYQPVVRKYFFDSNKGMIVLEPIVLKVRVNHLKDVNIIAVNPITIKEDTIEYSAGAYHVRQGAMVEEMLKKMPGISVDKNGNVTAQGKTVSKVQVNGKDFFGGDVKTATQNLPADIVEKIQIIDDYGDQARFSGVKTGDADKVLNIQVKKDKNNGIFGRVLAGAGNDDRYQSLVSANYFKNDKQVSVLGNFNNVNSDLFSFSAPGGGAGIPSAIRNLGSGGGGPGGGNAAGSTGTDGISDVKSIGANFRDQWGKLSVYGSYSLADQHNYTISQTLQQITSTGSTILNKQNTTLNTGKKDHRFTWNMEYSPDTLNYFKITPGFSYNKTSSDQNQAFNFNTTNGRYITYTTSASPTVNGTILYNHRFRRRGRNVSLLGSINDYQTNQDQQTNNISVTQNGQSNIRQLIANNNRTDRYVIQFSYLEPLTKTTFIEINYNFNRTVNNNDKVTGNIDPVTEANTRVDTLTNQYHYVFTTQQAGINLRAQQAKYNYTLGIGFQPSALDGTNLNTRIAYHNNTFNWVPTARFNYNFSRTERFTAIYSGMANQPSYSQLQPVYDYSNVQYPVVGNPNLMSEFTNSVSMRFNRFDISSGNIILTNFTVNQTENKIVSSNTRSSRPGVIQETSYLNADGYYSFNGFYVFSKPFNERMYTLTLTGNATYASNISYINHEKNDGQNLVLRQQAGFRTDLDAVMDVEATAAYSLNKNQNSLSSQISSRVSNWILGINGKNYFGKNLILGYDLTKTLTSGYANSVNGNPLLLNTYVEVEFLKNKMASVKLSGFDLFNENTNLSRSVDGNTVSDTQVNRLGRYYMFSLCFKFQKFGL